jgi:predicted PurR-regulated permease PerM
MLIYASVSSFVDRFPEYSGHFTTMITGLLEKLEIPIKDLNSYVANINWEQIINPSKVTAIISSTFGDIGGFIGDLLLVLLFLMFMLAGRESMLRRLKKAFIEDRAEKIGNIINSVENQVQSYLLIKTLVNLSVATICGFIMFIGGFDFVIFSALLIFFLSFIPNFGSIVATLFPVLTGFIKFGFSFRLIAVTLGLMVTQFIIGNVFEPKITGKSLDISPIVIMMSLIFWGYVWGIVGMILAVPLTSALKIIFQNIPTLSPLAEIISSD